MRPPPRRAHGRGDGGADHMRRAYVPEGAVRALSERRAVGGTAESHGHHGAQGRGSEGEGAVDRERTDRIEGGRGIERRCTYYFR